MKRALVLGATGLVGSYVLEKLLMSPEYDEVVVLTRSHLDKKHPKLKEVVADFSQLESLSAEHFEVADVFSCLGTTRSKTKEQEKYREIEIKYPSTIARRVLASGGRGFHYVSSVGASKYSRSWYARIKAESEEELRNIQKTFPMSYIVSYRPSFILGPRKEKRLMEKVAMAFFQSIMGFWVNFGPLKKYRSIHAEVIARGMVKKAREQKSGFFILESHEIQQLGE